MNIKHLVAAVILSLTGGSFTIHAAANNAGTKACPAACCAATGGKVSCPCPSCKMAMPPAAFAQTVATIDMLEIQLGKVALRNSTSEPVKKLGQCMVTQHTKINQNLTKVAASQGITIPTILDAKHAAIVRKLSALKGTAFDNAYVPAMVAGHTKALAMFQNQSKNCTNPALKKFAKQTTPIIAHHLKMAKKVQAELKQ